MTQHHRPTPLFPCPPLFRSGRPPATGSPRRRCSCAPGCCAGPRWRCRATEFAVWSLKCGTATVRSEEHTSELSHVAISYAVFCLKKKKKHEKRKENEYTKER